MTTPAPTFVREGNQVLAFYEDRLIAEGTVFAEVEQSALEYLDNLTAKKHMQKEEARKASATHIETPSGLKGEILGRHDGHGARSSSPFGGRTGASAVTRPMAATTTRSHTRPLSRRSRRARWSTSRARSMRFLRAHASHSRPASLPWTTSLSGPPLSSAPLPTRSSAPPARSSSPQSTRSARSARPLLILS